MPVTTANFDDVMMHHPPRADQIPKYDQLRKDAALFVKSILEHTEVCADQQAAIRHVRDALMTANAAVALDGKI